MPTRKGLPEPIAKLRRERRWPKGVPMPKAGAYSGGSRWTHEEERLLKRYYPRYGGRYCARLLGRTFSAVTIRAQRINVVSRSRFWTDKDIACLKQQYGTMPNEKLARTFGRDVESMLAKARLLGLRTQAPRWSKNELALLRSLYGTIPVKQIAERLQRPHGSILQLAQRLGLAQKRPRVTKAIERAIVKQVGRVSITAIAAQFHLSTEHIRAITKAHGCELQPGWRPNGWRPEEDTFLREHYSTMRIVDIAQHLGRSAQSIQWRVRKLGVPAVRAYNAREVCWSGTEENILRKLYGRVAIEELAERLSRTPKAIKTHAALLGLRLRALNPALPQLWTPAEDATLRRLYNTKTNQQIADHLGRPLRSVSARAVKFGLRKERPGHMEWTAQDDRQLRQLHRTLAPTAIAKQLGRTLNSVRGRMYKLGILVQRTSKPPVWTAAEDLQLTTLSRRHTWAEIAVRLGRTENSVKIRASRAGIRAYASQGKRGA